MAANTVELWLEFDDTYQRGLVIPLGTCTRFATFPLLWLSYLGFCFCARQGYISDSPDGPEIEYRKFPAITSGVYYYIARDPLWLDEEVMNDRTSYVSARTARRQSFRQDIVDRDGTCVVTSELPNGCQACHIIPHSRGDQYISNIAGYRGEPVEPPLEGINDIRNGLLLEVSLHRPFGESRIAFLRVPNHAMNVTDVNHITQPNSAPINDDVKERLILQQFHTDSVVLNLISPHNCDVRISNSADWPPDLLFDITYGTAALKSWGDPDFRALLQGVNNRGRGRGRGGREGENEGRGRGGGVDSGSKQEPSARDRRAAEREARRAEAEGQAVSRDSQGDCLDLILAFWAHNAKKREHQAEVKNADRTQDKVRSWLNSTA